MDSSGVAWHPPGAAGPACPRREDAVVESEEIAILKGWKRSPEDNVLMRDVEEIETGTVNGRRGLRTLWRREKLLDDDLLVLADRYRAFRREHPEPGT